MMPVDNPCIGVCKIHPTYRICRGCYRSPVELRVWSSATDKIKEQIIQRLSAKKKLFGDIKDE